MRITFGDPPSEYQVALRVACCVESRDHSGPRQCGEEEAMTKRYPYATIANVRTMLVEQFPNAFKGFKEPKKPLKVGIYNDIRKVMPELSGKTLHAVLADYTGGPTYLEGLKAGRQRVGLDGHPAGEVTPNTEIYAQQRAEHIRQQREMRREKDKANSRKATTEGDQASA